MADQPDAGQGQGGRGGQELKLLQDAVSEEPGRDAGLFVFCCGLRAEGFRDPDGLLPSPACGRGEPGSSGVGCGWPALASAGVCYWPALTVRRPP
ncbi:hypothetical protein CBM2585_A10035 [Cupriavidus taiwanensis]|nr:hypothetical protein CBM2585_A10035 [Cupriavidus taiwanensis]